MALPPIRSKELCLAPEQMVCKEPEASEPSTTEVIAAKAKAVFTAVKNTSFVQNHYRFFKNPKAYLTRENFMASWESTVEMAPKAGAVALAVAYPPVGVPVAATVLAACSNHPPLKESPRTRPATDPSNADNPPVVRGGEDGTGNISTIYADSSCETPLDLDQSSKDENNLLMSCGDDILSGNTDGIGLIEKINVKTGEVSSIKLPGVVDGDENKPVYLSATVAPKNGIILTGFSPSGSPAQFLADSTRLANSGVFFLNEANTNPQTVTFKPFQRTVGEEKLSISLSNHLTLNTIQPNSPVSMTWLGDTALVLNSNKATHPDESKEVLNAPLSIHPLQINENGNLTASDPYLVDGAYYPTAIAAVDEERFVVVARGVDYNLRGEDIQAAADAKESGIIPPNPSKLLVYDKNFAPGFDPGPDSAGAAEIPLADAANTEFVANNARQVPVVQIDGVPHAIVGSADTTGRVAIVNLDRDPSKVFGESRVEFRRAFDDGSDIANIVVSEDQKYAYVISSDGEVVTMTLDPAKNFRVTDSAKKLVDLVPDSGILPAARSGNVMVVASPGTYSAAGIVKPSN